MFTAEIVEPALVTREAKGVVKSLKYDRLTAVLIKTIKEQQAQIDGQQEQIRKQHQQIDTLIKLLHSRKPQTHICTEI